MNFLSKQVLLLTADVVVVVEGTCLIDESGVPVVE
jgi:hypothetical protein